MMDYKYASVSVRLEGVMTRSPLQVAEGMIEAATVLGLPVTCNINGAELHASPGLTTLDDLERLYEILLDLPDANRRFNSDGTRRAEKGVVSLKAPPSGEPTNE